MASAPRAVGIDFGTTNTAASVLRADGQVDLIELDPGATDPRLMKTLLYFPTRKEAFFGGAAIEQYFERDREGRFLQSIKRLLPNQQFQGTTVHGKFVSLEELISRFLTETRLRIERALGVTSLDGIDVILGRPARYSLEPGREGLAVVRFRKACEMAGFPEKSRYVEEPVAAAFTYVPPAGSGEERVLVADLGGGTSDFTLMAVKSGAKPRVLSTNGVPIAGDALDSDFVTAKLIRFFGSEIKYRRPFSENILTMPTTFMRLLPKWHHHAFLKEKSVWEFLRTLHHELIDPKQDKPLLENLITLVDDNLGYALHRKVEELKCALSDAASADFAFNSYPVKIEFPMPRAEYEQLLEPSIEPIRAAAVDTLRQANVPPADLHAVYFTGGTSRVPRIRDAILKSFPNARVADQDTFTSVAKGLVLTA